jgi:hypothetical protein
VFFDGRGRSSSSESQGGKEAEGEGAMMSDDAIPEALADWFWLGFIRWAWSEKKIRDRFVAETGITLLPPARSGIEALVDDACGVRDSILKAFVKWATIEIYGLEGAPKKYRDELAKEDTHST